MANPLLSATPPEMRQRRFERSRTYVFSGGDRLTFLAVTAIAISSRGTHRLELQDGNKIIVKPTWLAIEIDSNEWEF